MTLPLAYRAVLLAAALLLAWNLFWQLTVLLLALLLTVIVALPLTAATDWLQRRHVPRPVGATASMLIALAALAGLVALLVPTLVAQFDQFVADLPAVVDDLQARLSAIVGGASAGAGADVQAFVQGYLDEPMRLVGLARNVLTSAVTLLGGVLLVLLTALYAAINPQPLVDALVRLVPPDGRGRAREILARLRRDWLGWLKGIAVDAVLTGALTYAGLSLLGLDHALVFAVLTGLLEVVPYFGPILAAIPPVLFALTQSVELALLTLALFTVIQQVEGNVIVPLVMSQAVRLHPAFVAFGVVIIGQLFGLVGILLAVPLLTAIVVLVDELWVRPHEQRAKRHDRLETPDGVQAATRSRPARAAPGGRSSG